LLGGAGAVPVAHGDVLIDHGMRWISGFRTPRHAHFW
jgi:isopentenyl phosphate kinase